MEAPIFVIVAPELFILLFKQTTRYHEKINLIECTMRVYVFRAYGPDITRSKNYNA